MDEVEKKTRELDTLNRRLEKIVATQPGTTPLRPSMWTLLDCVNDFQCAGAGAPHIGSKAACALIVGVLVWRGRMRLRQACGGRRGCVPWGSRLLTHPGALAAAEAVNSGPLEATITNMTKEIDSKEAEGGQLQRIWITKQAELVALQASTGLPHRAAAGGPPMPRGPGHTQQGSASCRRGLYHAAGVCIMQQGSASWHY